MSLLKVVAKEIAKSVELERNVEKKVSFNISGEVVLKQGDDYEQIVNFAVPYEKLLAVALSKLNGVTINSIVKEALSGEIDTTELKTKAVQSMAEIKGKARRNCRGKITIQSERELLKEVDICTYC